MASIDERAERVRLADLSEEDSDKPLHVRLSNEIRDLIYRHELVAGQQIPSEHEFMDRYGMSRGTVRRAIKTLVDEGLLVQRHGRGTFVAQAALAHPAAMRPLSFAESLAGQGMDFVTEVLTAKIMVSNAEAAVQLDMERDKPVFFLRRVRRVGGTPIMCLESLYNLDVCPGIDKYDFTRVSAFDAVEQTSGGHITSSHMTYMARVAGLAHGEYLEVDEASPVLLLEQQICLEDGTPAEWSLTWLPAGQTVVGTATQCPRE